MTHVALADAEGQLSDLIRRAEEGEDIVVTRYGQGVVRLTPIPKAPLTPEERLKVLRQIQEEVKDKFEPGFSAARSQDFLYGEDGLPG